MAMVSLLGHTRGVGCPAHIGTPHPESLLCLLQKDGLRASSAVGAARLRRRSTAPCLDLHHASSCNCHSHNRWDPGNAQPGYAGPCEGGGLTVTLVVAHQGHPWTVWDADGRSTPDRQRWLMRISVSHHSEEELYIKLIFFNTIPYKECMNVSIKT